MMSFQIISYIKSKNLTTLFTSLVKGASFYMSRRQAREIALQSLFQLDFNECEVDSAIENVLSHKNFMKLIVIL